MNCRETQPMLTAFHDGELHTADRARVEEHLRGCPECVALLAGLARVDRAAGVPDPGPAYWHRFNARVMDRIAREADDHGWSSAGTGRDASGSSVPADAPGVTVLRPKGGWIRQQLRYLVPAAAAAALAVGVVHYGGMRPVAPTPTAPPAASDRAAGPARQPMAMDGQVPGQAGTPRVLEPRPPALDQERIATGTREERDRLEDRPLPSKNVEASRDRAAAPAGIDAPSPIAEPRPAAKAEPASGMNMAKDQTAEAPAEASLGKTRSKEGPSSLASARPADGQGRPSAGAGKDAPGSVAPASPCERARALAVQERWREAEAVQRACLAQDPSAPAREKGLVFLAELLDRQARFAEADAVISEVDRQFPQSRPLDLYRQQRPMVQKQPMTAPVAR